MNTEVRNMVVNVRSKDELQAIAGKLKNVSAQLSTEAANVISNLSEIEDFDGIYISQAATVIQNNLKSISGEVEMRVSRLNNYVADIKSLDTYDLQNEEHAQNISRQDQEGNEYSNRSNDSYEGANSLVSNSGENNNAIAEGNVATTLGDPDYDLGDRYHEYVEPIFQMTRGNLAYEIGDNDFDLLCAIVSAEGDQSYDGSLAVVSTILNRCEHPNYVALHGASPISQATANNQFFGYCSNGYQEYIHGKYPESVTQAVEDALAGVRNHKVCDFNTNNMVVL